MHSCLLVGLTISMAGIAFAEESTLESNVIAKIELLGGRVTRDDALPGHPVVGIKFGKGSRFGDKSAHFLSHVPHLARLHLSGLQISDLWLRKIATLETLTEVDLYKCPLVTDAGVQELMKLRNLTYLGCMNCEQISDEAVQGIENLTQLKTLYIGGVQFTDIGALQIDGLKELNELAVSGRVSDAGLKAIVRLNGLTNLHLGRTQITDASMKELMTLRNLKMLDLCETVVSDEGLKQLQKFPKLAELRLDGCQLVTDVGVLKLQEALPNLQISR